mmetsp:Transcript_63654/g.170392  ORF Transcript_63654/g.170392 Transcript_63654/m.170392 type:complete len:517 (+) Transcript_63654:2597-4147(+)
MKNTYLVNTRVTSSNAWEALTNTRDMDLDQVRKDLVVLTEEIQQLDTESEQSGKPITKVDSSKLDSGQEILTFFSMNSWVPCINNARKRADADRKTRLENGLRIAQKKFATLSIVAVEKEVAFAHANELSTGVDLVGSWQRLEDIKKSVHRSLRLLDKALETLSFWGSFVLAEVEKAAQLADQKALQARPKPGATVDEDSPLQIRARKARMALDKARLNPELSRARMITFRRMLVVLEIIFSFDKEIQGFNSTMLAKSRAKLFTKLAVMRKDKLVSASSKKQLHVSDSTSKLDRSIEDIENELRLLTEPNIRDLTSRITQLRLNPQAVLERQKLEAQLENVQKQQNESQWRSSVLNFEFQHLTMLLGAAQAEDALWKAWLARCAADDTDRPRTDHAQIRDKLKALSLANSLINKVINDAEAQSKEKVPPKTSPLAHEPKPATALADWHPSTEWSAAKITKALSRLQSFAARVGRHAKERLNMQSPYIPFDVTKTSMNELQVAEKEVESIAQVYLQR